MPVSSEAPARPARNPLSLTVVFPAPAEPILHKYQLACDKGRAHAIIMPNVDDGLIDRFLADYIAWWQSTSPLSQRKTCQMAS